VRVRVRVRAGCARSCACVGSWLCVVWVYGCAGEFARGLVCRCVWSCINVRWCICVRVSNGSRVFEWSECVAEVIVVGVCACVRPCVHVDAGCTHLSK